MKVICRVLPMKRDPRYRGRQQETKRVMCLLPIRFPQSYLILTALSSASYEGAVVSVYEHPETRHRRNTIISAVCERLRRIAVYHPDCVVSAPSGDVGVPVAALIKFPDDCLDDAVDFEFPFGDERRILRIRRRLPDPAPVS